MKYLSLYRKYRPQNFGEITGQEFIIKTLGNSIKNNSFSHAYLFAGPRGTGKTSTAKIFAKAINCISKENIKPCNKCKICTGINKNLITDVIEFDAASNNGVDEIRNIRNNIKLLPLEANYKVYIIDEIHMLTISAFNALLKTLEEPPAHIVFIFATTEFHKVPVTIISRCQQYIFKLMPLLILEKQMKNILQKENIKYEDQAINTIAHLAKGSSRDALSILEQIIMFSEDKLIKNEQIYDMFALVNDDQKLNS